MKLVLMLVIMISSIISSSAITKSLTIEGSVGKLNAVLQTPDEITADSKYPLVIICHGFNGNCELGLMKEIADDVVTDGMAALRFDFNGHGKSEGKFQDMTVLNEIQDLENVIKWAMNQGWVQSISLVGHSQGGVVVSMTAGELGDKIIHSEVLLSAAAVLRDDALRGYMMGTTYDPWNFPGDYIEVPLSPEYGTILLGKEYVKVACNLPIYETARNYIGPTLIIAGTHDRIVPYTYAERFNHEIKSSELCLVPDENHDYTLTQSETALYVADWLRKML